MRNKATKHRNRSHTERLLTTKILKATNLPVISLPRVDMALPLAIPRLPINNLHSYPLPRFPTARLPDMDTLRRLLTRLMATKLPLRQHRCKFRHLRILYPRNSHTRP